MSQPDYYAVLGVLPTAPADEITRAWRRLVLAVSDNQRRRGALPCLALPRLASPALSSGLTPVAP